MRRSLSSLFLSWKEVCPSELRIWCRSRTFSCGIVTCVYSKKKPLLTEESYAGTSVIIKSPNIVTLLRELQIYLFLQMHDSYTFFF